MSGRPGVDQAGAAVRESMATDPQLEKLVLRALCTGTPEGPVKDMLVPLLRGYSWQLQIHQVIFDALAGVPSSDPEVIRQLLPAKLTRLGFPDVEWEEFFTPHSLSRGESIALARRMLAGA